MLDNLETGFRDLDRILGGLRPGALTVAAAEPGQGVQTFLLGVAASAAPFCPAVTNPEVLAAQRHPDTVAERARFQNHEDTKAWDRALSLWLLLANVAVLLLAGPDARLDWTPCLSVAIKTVALLAMLAGFALSSYALIGNRYFSAVVRIQTDRDQHVRFTGPYAWVRHPGYAGGLLVYLATPALHSAPPISALPGATRSRFQQIYPNWPKIA